jgi:hypothetical protein
MAVPGRTHGFWVTPRSWEDWIARYGRHRVIKAWLQVRLYETRAGLDVSLRCRT